MPAPDRQDDQQPASAPSSDATDAMGANAASRVDQAKVSDARKREAATEGAVTERPAPSKVRKPG